jgi:hypothetical protein
MDVIDKMLLFIFKGIQNNYKKEVSHFHSSFMAIDFCSFLLSVGRNDQDSVPPRGSPLPRRDLEAQIL